MNSPFSSLLTQIISRIAENTNVRFVTQDIGQLENYEIRPAVSWPCCLIDIDAFNFTDAQNNYEQLGQGSITVRIGLVKYTDLNNLTPEAAIDNAVNYLETEQQVYKALHAWAPEGFSRCMRINTITERRDDDIRVRVLKFSISFTDESAKPVKQTIPRPDLSIGN